MKTTNNVATIIILTAVSLCGLASLIRAQEVRGSINGRIIDPTGSVVPGARVTVINTETNVTVSLLTNDEGLYTANFLLPGLYAVTAEAPGYKKLVRGGVQVRVADRLELNLALEVGALGETVNVTSQAPLLETNSASLGQVVGSRLISELPLPDGNPFSLARLAPGMLESATNQPVLTNAFDVGNTAGVSTNGLGRGSEFTLDGSPNTGFQNRAGYVPPADAVDEFKIQTNSFDAATGHTAAATINVGTRSGKNDFFGTLSHFIRNDAIAANTFFNNRQGQAPPALRYNRFGGTIGGPVRLPRQIFGPLGYEGRDRTFFFFAYEGQLDKRPAPQFFTVPTLAEREGDFSALLTGGIRIYDPATAVQTGARVSRTAFPNNVIPKNRLNPLALGFLRYFPLPNAPGDAEGRNNFFSENPVTNDYNTQTARIDHVFSERQRSYGRYSRNARTAQRNRFSEPVNGVFPAGQVSYLGHDALTFDHVYVASSRTTFNLRATASVAFDYVDPLSQGQVDLTTFGFNPRALAAFERTDFLPIITVENFQALGSGIPEQKSHIIYALQPSLITIWGSQAIKAGYDGRLYREHFYDNRPAAGSYTFGSLYTKELDNSPALHGQGLASFLLGIPTAGEILRTPNYANQQFFHAFYFQDDWKIARKLTLNLGLRYELEGAPTERFNRNVRDFDRAAATAPAIEAAAQARFAATPAANRPPEVTGAFPTLRGGYLFAGEQARAFYQADKNNFQPRLGFAYQLTDKTVLRGGFGIYYSPFGVDSRANQDGYSITTTIVASDNVGLNFNPSLNRPCLVPCSTFDSPFPTGVNEPTGNSLGLATFLGRAIRFVNPDDVRNSQFKRWQFGVQRELPGQWVVDLTYLGQHGSDLAVVRNINALPRQYLATSPTRDEANIAYLTTRFANPLRGLLPADTVLGRDATINRELFLAPFPQFGAINQTTYEGSFDYHSGQVRAEKRFSQGYTMTFAYTWSKGLEENSFLNPTDTELERRLTREDVPHRLAIAGIFELPFGKGRRLVNGLPGALDAVVGGWQLGAVYQYQTGVPLDFGNFYFNGSAAALKTLINGDTATGAVCPRSACPGDANRLHNIFGVDLRTSGFYLTDELVKTNG